MPKSLSVYEFVTDWVVAYSSEDALEIIKEHYGVDLDEFSEPEDIEAGAQRIHGQRVLRLVFDPEDIAGPAKRFNVPPNAEIETHDNRLIYTATATQWAAVWDRSILGSEEY